MRCLWWDSLHWAEPEVARSFLWGWQRGGMWNKDREVGVTVAWGTGGAEGVAESSQCCGQGCGCRERSFGAQHCISKPVSRTQGTASCPPWPANRSSAKLSKNKTSPAKYTATILEQLETAYCGPEAPLKRQVSTLWWSGYQKHGQIALLLVGDVEQSCLLSGNQFRWRGFGSWICGGFTEFLLQR